MKNKTFALLTVILAFFMLLGCEQPAQAPLDSSKEITSLRFEGLDPVVNCSISGTAITGTVPYGTDVRSLVASFTKTGISVSVGGVSQKSGVTINDYTNPVVYTVTAADGSEQDYTVTITVGLITYEQLKQMIENNEDVTDVDTSGITSMKELFRDNDTFNQDISGWDVSNVTDMSSMFYNAKAFNQDISNWNVSNVTDMSHMFGGADVFNGNISGWNVGSVTSMSFMFYDADAFNGDISLWDVGSVTNMHSMFFSADSFNGNISGWNVSNVTNMSWMFFSAAAFNQNISSWNVGSVTDMCWMFWEARVFNQNLSGWDVSNVTNMAGMFKDAAAFNQDISGWKNHIAEDIPHGDFSAGACPLTPAHHPYASWDS